MKYVDVYGYQPIVTKPFTFLYKLTPLHQTLKYLNQHGKANRLFSAFGFIRDNTYGTYHAKFDCWQAAFGYNNLYDFFFNLGTDMKNKKYQFSYNGQNYIFWAWKGDYLNLGAGGEVGIYKSVRKNGKHIWKVDKSMAQYMMLTVLYNKNASSIYDFDLENEKPIIVYGPEEKQWWITGFNPAYQNVKAKNLAIICTIGFEDIGLFKAFYDTYKNKNVQIDFWPRFHSITIYL